MGFMTPTLPMGLLVQWSGGQERSQMTYRRSARTEEPYFTRALQRPHNQRDGDCLPHTPHP